MITLGGAYAQDMATQAELDAVAALAGGDLPEYATTAQTAAVGTTANLAGKTTRYDTTSAAINQTLPPATTGRVLAVGWDAGSNALTFTAAGSDVIGSGAATTAVPAIVGETITLHCTTAGRWRTVSGFKPQSGLDARYQQVLTLAPAKGDGTTDDSATINAILAAAPAGAVVRGVPGKNYLVRSSLVLRAGGAQTLDMSGCTVTLAADSNVPAVVNSALTATSTVPATAMTSGTSAVTSSAAFTNTLNGKQVAVAGAGLNGAPTYGTFSYTDASNGTITPVVSATPTSAITALTTVSGASMSVFGRDADVTVRGGTWVRVANTGAVADDYRQHTIVMRRVDRLRVEDVRVKNTDSKYGISLGDVTDFTVERISFATQSDGVHITGPARAGTVRAIRGTTGDDLVSCTALDYWNAGIKAKFADVSGDICDMLADDIAPTNCAAGVKILAGNYTRIRGLFVRNVTGTTVNAAIIAPDDNTGSSNVSFTLDGLRVKCADTTAPISLGATSGQDVHLKNLHFIVPSTFSVSGNALVFLPGGASWQNIVIDGVSCIDSAAAAPLVLVPSTSSVQDLVLRGVNYQRPSQTNDTYIVSLSGTVSRLKVSDSSFTKVHAILLHQAGAALTKVMVANTSMTQGNYPLSMGSVNGANIELANCDFDCVAYVRATAASGTVFVRSSGVRGLSGSSKGVTRTSTAVVRVVDVGMPADIAELTPANGDTVYNVGATGVGAGAVVYDGTSWKPLGRAGAQGTATLVAGTVNVANTAITATSLIRLTTLGPRRHRRLRLRLRAHRRYRVHNHFDVRLGHVDGVLGDSPVLTAIR